MQIVSLTTDYGTKDYYVAELKASILSSKSDFTIIDISHQIDNFDIIQAAFYLENAMKSFPTGAIHIVAVNCNYKRKSKFVCFEKNNQYFIGPDNGIFSLIFDDFTTTDVYEIIPPENGNSSVRSIFSHAAACIGHKLSLQEVGNKIEDINRKLVIQPVVTAHQIRATIIHIDHFQNVIVNLKKDLFDKVRNERRFELYYKPNDPITFLCKDYSDVAIGDTLAFFNSAGFLEIAINMEQAAAMLNLSKNEMIQINFL